MTGSRRGLALVTIAVMLVGGAVADRVDRPHPSRSSAPAPINQAQPVTALSSTWYCAAGTAGGGGEADGTVVVANTASRQRRGTFTVFTDNGQSKSIAIVVPPRSSIDLRYASVVTAPWAAGLVEMDGGGVAAEQVVSGPLGRDVAPCARTASDQWHFAAGSTAKDSSMTLAFFNPFPDVAIVDLRFATDEGPKVPGDFQGIVVPPRSVAVREVGDHVRRRDAVSATVSVRSGRLVAARIQRFSTPARSGLGLSVGAPEARSLWYLPEGFYTDGITERYEIYNPARREAVVQLALAIEGGGAEPFELTVPAQGRLTLIANEQDRIPKGKAHAATVRSLNGVAVVVEETVDAVAPAARRGFFVSAAAAGTALRWVMAAGSATETSDEWIVVHNPGPKPVRVSLYALAQGQRVPIETLQALLIPAGSRRSYRVSDHIRREKLTVLVEADRPVIAARSLYRVDGPGISSTPGISLR